MNTRMEIKDLYNMKMISQTAAAADGSLAVTETVLKEKEQIYASCIRIIAADGSQTVLANGDHNSDACFSSDAKMIFYLSDADGESQLWKYCRESGESTQLTHFRYGVDSFVKSPDDRMLYAVCERDDSEAEELVYVELTEDEIKEREEAKKNKAKHITKLVYKFDGRGYLSNRKGHVFAVDAATGAARRLSAGEHNFRELVQSSDGRYLAYIGDAIEHPDFRPVHFTLWLYDLKEEKQTLLVSENLQVERPVFAADNTKIFFGGMDAAEGYLSVQHLWSCDIATGEHRDLTPDDGFDYAASDLGDFRRAAGGQMIADAAGENIYMSAVWHGNLPLYRIGLDAQKETVIDGERCIINYVLSADEKTMYFIDTDNCNPCRLNKKDLVTGEETLIYDPNEAFFAGKELAVPERITISSFDNIPIEGWIMKPIGYEEGKKYPVVLEIHGGPECMYANSFMHEFQVLAAHGYAVAYFNPRGSSGYGQKLQLLIARRFGGNGGGDYLDLMCGMDEVEKLPYIDAEHMYVTGGSYGGFMTNWVVGHTDRFKAAVAQRSVTNWITMMGNSDDGYCDDYLGHQCDFFTEPFELQRISPITYAKDIHTPLLLLHSEFDYRCPLEQAEQMFAVLKLLGRTVEMKIFPGQSHGLSRIGRPVLREERLQSILDWFDTYR